jgi:FkbM family methyltransferase
MTTIFESILPDRPGRALVPGEPILVFGTGTFGRTLAKALAANGFEVKGFIQTQPISRVVDDLPVFGWPDLLTHNCQITLMVGIFNREAPFDELVRLSKNAGFKKIMLPWDFYGQLSRELGWCYWLEDQEFLSSHLDDLIRTYHRLADDESRLSLQRLVQFRSGSDLAYSSFRHADSQYFNSITMSYLECRSSKEKGGVRYIDGGAYDGDTYRELRVLTKLGNAYLFEPDQANYVKLVQSVASDNSTASCIPLALADRHKILRFFGGLGEAGHIDDVGENAIAAVSIDEFLAGAPVDFVKLDLEGGEVDALKGAAHTLIAHSPVLAISCYHNPQDLWALPDLIAGLVPNYKLYLRQHMFNSFDLVLYAIPA